MDECGAVGDDLDASASKRVDDFSDRLLVAGNGARGKDDGVASAYFCRRMLVPRHACERRAWLALAAGGESQYPITRQSLESIHAQERWQAFQHPALACDANHALDRPAENADLSPGGKASLSR